MDTLNTIQYLEDIPDMKEYQATFCITLKVTGEDEAEAVNEAWECLQSKMLNIIETEADWFDNFELKVEEL